MLNGKSAALRLVMMAEGNHAFPSRTRPLSPPAPRVLEPQGSGRVGRCQAKEQPFGSIPRRLFFLIAMYLRSSKGFNLLLGVIPLAQKQNLAPN